jgi:hypothetical protein
MEPVLPEGLTDRFEDAIRTPRYVEALTKVIQEFLAQLDYTKMARGANHAEMQMRKADIRKAFSIFCASQLGSEPNVTIDNPLRYYVYIADVYGDAYSFMFEYIGEVEHQFGLNFSIEGHPYNTGQEMWREDFLLAHCEYMS